MEKYMWLWYVLTMIVSIAIGFTINNRARKAKAVENHEIAGWIILAVWAGVFAGIAI